ncbi:MAG TPA: hypothetical protein VJU59_43165 [Paraburkholderia sp.]|nr:hypothetical protein [Paraburkholderia sp.]
MSNLLFCTDLRSDFDRLHGRKAGAVARYPKRLRATCSASSSSPPSITSTIAAAAWQFRRGVQSPRQ